MQASTNTAIRHHRYRVGAIDVTVIPDGARSFPLPDNFVVNASKEQVNAALQAAGMEKDTMTIVFNPIVINTGSMLVVFDTGNGPAAFAQSNGTLGQFHSGLKAAGFDANAVDVVIISHFHGDHINGLLGADNTPAFPKAEVFVPAAEWAFWCDDGHMSRAAAGSPVEANFKNVRRVFGALGNKVTQYKEGEEVVAGLSHIATPGHTPGHTSMIIGTGPDRVIAQADVTNRPALFVRNPNWHAGFDMDGAQAEQTRRRIYEMAATEKLRIQGFHYPFPSCAKVEKDGTGYRLDPAIY